MYGNFNKNLEGVIRGICAFLNSDGGILIWGAPEGREVEARQEKVFSGDLALVPELKEKDWFINKVSDSITPLPIGINLQRIENGGNYVYIFEIQKSTYSPHQFKNTYFARLDGQTKPAPHYLIDALFNKITYPQIECFIKPTRIEHNGTNYFLNIEIYMFNFSELQNEEDAFYRLMCPQGIFMRSQLAHHSHMYSKNGHQLIYKDIINVLHFGAPEVYSERIQINPNEILNHHSNKIQLFLTFGGKNSPLKSSEYTLNLRAINWSDVENPNYLFESIVENKLFSEIQKDKEMTREKTLEAVLER